MTTTIAVLTEQELSPEDAGRVVALHASEDIRYRVLVPADTRRSLLADVLDHLSLFELREALRAVRHRDEGHRADASRALESSVTQLRAAGAQVEEGSVVDGDPVAALAGAVEAGAGEVVVVTRPHAVEDTFHTDWASRARELLGVPVLHVYAGTSRLG